VKQTRRGILAGTLAAGVLFAPVGASAALAARSAPSAVNACLVGRWSETRERDAFLFNGAPVILTGGAGRTLRFSPHGTEITSYANAQPLTATLADQQLELDPAGTVAYRMRTAGNRLTFESADYSRSIMSGSYGGRPITLASQTLPGPERFSCSATRLTERGADYRASFKRG